MTDLLPLFGSEVVELQAQLAEMRQRVSEAEDLSRRNNGLLKWVLFLKVFLYPAVLWYIWRSRDVIVANRDTMLMAKAYFERGDARNERAEKTNSQAVQTLVEAVKENTTPPGTTKHVHVTAEHVEIHPKDGIDTK